MLNEIFFTAEQKVEKTRQLKKRSTAFSCWERETFPLIISLFYLLKKSQHFITPTLESSENVFFFLSHTIIPANIFLSQTYPQSLQPTSPIMLCWTLIEIWLSFLLFMFQNALGEHTMVQLIQDSKLSYFVLGDSVKPRVRGMLYLLAAAVFTHISVCGIHRQLSIRPK